MLPPPESILDADDDVLSIARLAEHLKRLGLERWCSVLLIWLGRVRGIELYIPAEHAPLTQLLAWAEQRSTRVEAGEPQYQDDLFVAEELTRLDFVYYRARAENKHWDVTQQPFAELARRGPLPVWESTRPMPDRDTLRRWLLTQLEPAGQNSP